MSRSLPGCNDRPASFVRYLYIDSSTIFVLFVKARIIPKLYGKCLAWVMMAFDLIPILRLVLEYMDAMTLSRDVYGEDQKCEKQDCTNDHHVILFVNHFCNVSRSLRGSQHGCRRVASFVKLRIAALCRRRASSANHVGCILSFA